MSTDLFNQLATPFPAQTIKWKPQAVKGNRALAVAYLDARVVQDRLDSVLGPAGWEDSYQVLADGSVVCTLTVHMPDGKSITKMDVGSPSEQPDGGDRLKAAFSDALKRAAVKYGIGRYLYRLPLQWCDFDPAKKQFVNTPRLPAEFGGDGKAPERKQAALPPAANGQVNPNADKIKWLVERDKALATAGGRMGALLDTVASNLRAAGYNGDPKDLTKYDANAWEIAGHAARAFIHFSKTAVPTEPTAVPPPDKLPDEKTTGKFLRPWLERWDAALFNAKKIPKPGALCAAVKDEALALGWLTQMADDGPWPPGLRDLVVAIKAKAEAGQLPVPQTEAVVDGPDGSEYYAGDIPY